MKDSKNKIVVYNSASIQRKIYSVRNVQVMIDSDLAELYRVQTKVLNQAVKRNIERFPEEFRFKLTTDEKLELVTNCDHLQKLKYSPTLPMFSQNGALQCYLPF